MTYFCLFAQYYVTFPPRIRYCASVFVRTSKRRFLHALMFDVPIPVRTASRDTPRNDRASRPVASVQGAMAQSLVGRTDSHVRPARISSKMFENLGSFEPVE